MRRLIALIFFLALLFSCSALADAAENQRIIYTYLTEEMGLTRAAACGVLSNIKSESGFRPDAVGDSGAAYGICQWNSRRQSLINFCEKNGYESWKDINGQLGYLAYELSTSKKSVGNYLNAIPDTAQGAYDAAWYFCVYFEIPANRYDKGVTRGKNAVNTFYKQYGGSIATYTISYNANGGSKAPASGVKTEGVPFTVSSAAPVRAGYQLAGWSEDKSGQGTVYAPGSRFEQNRDTTLYAVWERSADADTPADGRIALNGHTYEYYAGAFSFARAKELAAAKGGYLASVRTAEEFAAVSALISNAAGPCWLGGKYAGGNWTWLSGESFQDDFAAGYWKSGEPAASVGASGRGCLAQTADGQWIDLAASSAEARGLVLEYGPVAEESFPVYLITVSTSLRLREGPGTSYDTLGYLYPSNLITICEFSGTGSAMWGWGFTGDGLCGWCSLKPEYASPMDWVDKQTGLALRQVDGGLCIMGMTRSASDLVLPETLGGQPVVAIAADAFTGSTAPARVTVPDCVIAIEKGAFETRTAVVVCPGGAAHFAAVQDGCAFEMRLPENSLALPEGILAVEDNAFRGNETLEFLDLSHVQSIGAGAFCGCTSLRAVQLGADADAISETAFDENTVIICPADSFAARWAEASGRAWLPPTGR